MPQLLDLGPPARDPPTCDSCGKTFPALRLATGTSYDERARAAGWRIWRGTTVGGGERDDTLCPRCARPDPRTVRLCEELAASVHRPERTAP